MQVKLSSSSEILKAPISLPRRKHIPFFYRQVGTPNHNCIKHKKKKKKKKLSRHHSVETPRVSLKSPGSTLTLPSSSSGIAGAGDQEASFPNPQQQLLDTQTQCTSVGQLLLTWYWTPEPPPISRAALSLSLSLSSKNKNSWEHELSTRGRQKQNKSRKQKFSCNWRISNYFPNSSAKKWPRKKPKKRHQPTHPLASPDKSGCATVDPVGESIQSKPPIKKQKPSFYPGPALSSHRQRLTSYYKNSYCCCSWWDCEGALVFVAINK